MENNTQDTARSQPAHTPGPWRVDLRKNDVRIVGAREGNGELVLIHWPVSDSNPMRKKLEQDAAFIVRAVNNHKNLLSELVGARAWIANMMTPGDYLQEQDLAKIDATISKAWGEK